MKLIPDTREPSPARWSDPQCHRAARYNTELVPVAIEDDFDDTEETAA